MSDCPLNGVTVITLGSDTKGMLLVKPPSKHLCKMKMCLAAKATIIVRTQLINCKQTQQEFILKKLNISIGQCILTYIYSTHEGQRCKCV